ncbi:hypothetical protein HQ520_14870 [bacterium]|nr:hypothetical protein [bacterium]
MLHRSADGGSVWSEVDRYLNDGGCLVMDPVCPEIVYMAGDSTGFEAAICRSEDGGKTWPLRVIPEKGRGKCLAMDVARSAPDVLYAGGRVYDRAALWKSADGGRTWASALGNLREGHEVGDSISVLHIDPENAELVWAGTSKGLFRSDDGGGIWRALAVPGPVVSLAFDAGARHYVAVVRDKGPFCGRDGEEWQRANSPAGVEFNRAIVDKKTGGCYVGSTAGLWRLGGVFPRVESRK